MKTYPKEQGLGMALMIIIIAAAVVIAGYFYMQSQKEARDAEMLQKETLMEKNNKEQEKSIYVELKSQNNSGQDGSATIVYMDGKAKVVINVPSGTKDIAQPAHIHMGTCPNPGAVTYPLTNVVNGISETIIDIPVEQLLNELPLAINVHKSAAEVKVYTSCGDIPEPPTQNTMMEGGDTMMGNSPKTVAVTYTDSGFDPNNITIKAGDTVRFVNGSSASFWPASAFHPTHTTYPGSNITKCGTPEAINIFDACRAHTPGESYSFTFNEIGKWNYHNHLSASFFGSIVVQ